MELRMSDACCLISLILLMASILMFEIDVVYSLLLFLYGAIFCVAMWMFP